jgi:CarD family transcriptional regulator
MYEIGDYVICRSGGVGRVTGRLDGALRLILHGGEDGAVKEVAEDDGEIVRKIMSREAILEVIDRIGFVRTIQAPNDKVRHEFYQEAMAQYDELEWVKVIKTAYMRQQERRLTPTETACSEKAKGYLHGEISVLLDMPADEVGDYIAAAVASW